MLLPWISVRCAGRLHRAGRRRLRRRHGPSPPRIPHRSPPRDGARSATLRLAVAAPAPLSVFISYAEEDARHRDELWKHLAGLMGEGRIRAWHEARLEAGARSSPAVAAKLDGAHVILLLISADYLAAAKPSAQTERALHRHEAGEARVIPVLVRDCDWKTARFGRLKSLPSDGRPVTSWPNADEAWTDVARGIRTAVGELEAAEVMRSHSGMPAMPEDMPPNNLPRQRSDFVGRDEELEALARSLAREHRASVIQSRQAAVYGLGGIGKTSIAIEYAYRYAAQYPGGIWWVDAEGDPFAAMVRLADVLCTVGPPEVRSSLRKRPKAQDKLAGRVRWILQNRQEPSLLVLDNITDPAWNELLPAGRVSTISTSRDVRLMIGRPVGLDVLSAEEAKKLAVLIAGDVSTPAEVEALDRIVRGDLGGFPVAVVAAASAVRRCKHSWAEYERHLRAQPSKLFSRHEAHGEYPRSVFGALAFSIDLCPPQSLERQLLNIGAFTSPDDLPFEDLDQLPVDGPLAALSSGSIEANDALATLDDLGLLHLDKNTHSASMHRLVQTAVRHQMNAIESRACVEAALRLVDHAFPESSEDVETWPLCARWLPHALSVTSHAETYDVAKDVRGRLIARFAVYLQGRAAFKEAKRYLERALALHEAVFGPDDPKVAAVLRSLGSVLHDLSDLHGARAHLERALAIDVARSGPDHPDVARDVNDLGSVLMDQGDVPGARKRLERALAIDEATYGPDDPSVAIRLNNLGTLFRDLGDFAGARVHLERALAIDIRAYGPDHPTVANGRTNLGRLLHDLGDLKGAREQFEEALKIDEHSYGLYHPRFALALNNRGRVLRDLGDLAGARADFERALAIVEDTYGPDHPDVARDINNLGSVLRDLGDLQGARANFARVLKISEATYGPNHPAVAIGCNNLGSVLQALGELPGAREQLERALGIAQATYGPDHPLIASIVNNLGRALQALGDLSGAWQMIERAVEIATNTLGQAHPSVQIFARNLTRLGDALAEASAQVGRNHEDCVQGRHGPLGRE
ncbi:FxSxx-COOH system tetratricopeptide repeat protein [Sorangium sp. So ce1667]